MLFHFLNFSPCVHKTINKVTNLKVHSKGRYFGDFFQITFQELQRTARLDYSCFPVFVTSQIVNNLFNNNKK